MITNVPLVYVDTLALTDASPAAGTCQIPAAVAVVTSVRVAPTGTTATATQFVPSTVPSNVTVPENVPVICHATAPPGRRVAVSQRRRVAVSPCPHAVMPPSRRVPPCPRATEPACPRATEPACPRVATPPCRRAAMSPCRRAPVP